jgi:hypothetical protein
MKHLSSILITALTLGWLATGCSSSIKVETAPLEQSFASAPAMKADADKAAASIKTGDYAAAVTSLQKVVKAGALTPEQKDAVIKAVSGMQMVAAQDPKKYPVEVYQALSDLVALADGQQPITK